MSNYKTTKILGRGRSGFVYLARDGNCAVKIFCTQDREKNLFDSAEQKQVSWQNYERELRNLYLVKGHSKIIDIRDTGTTEHGEPFIVVNFIDGKNLEQELANGPFSFFLAYKVLEHSCLALQCCHEKGLIHRDVTTKNLLIVEDSVTLIDFDQALTLKEMNEETRLIGKTHYFAPEYVARIHALSHGKKAPTISFKTDMYSLGVTVYRILTKSVPFGVSQRLEKSSAQKQRYDLAIKRLTKPPTPIKKRVSSIPKNLDRITMKLLEKRPRDRYGTWEELLDDICKSAKTDLSKNIRK